MVVLENVIGDFLGDLNEFFFGFTKCWVWSKVRLRNGTCGNFGVELIYNIGGNYYMWGKYIFGFL